MGVAIVLEQRNEPVYRADILFDEQCVGGPAARLLDGLFDFLKATRLRGERQRDWIR
ncbi:MAG: hypothetical protein ACLR8P_15260 [Clostridium fessum]